MPIAGSTDLAQLTLVVYADDTAVSLAVRNPIGAVNTIAVSKVAGQPIWRGRVPLTMPGTWWQMWTVTGTGEGQQTLEVPVSPNGIGDDPRHTYATTVDLANYTYDAPPVDAERMLRDATAIIDDLIMCAIYDVDTDGMPTDPADISCLMRAVCEQVKWRTATGDDDTAGLYSSVSIGGVHLSRDTSGRGITAAFARVGPGVADILYQGGFLGGAGPWGF